MKGGGVAASLRGAIEESVRAPVASGLGAVALGLGVAAALLAGWVAGTVGEVVAALEVELTVRVMLDPALDEAGTERVLGELAAVAGVREVRWVGPQEQRAELAGVLGDDALAGLDEAVFPAGGLVRVGLERVALEGDGALDAIAGRLGAVERVESVVGVPADLRPLRFLFALGGMGAVVAWLIGGLAAVTGAFSVWLLVVRWRLARREEHEIYRAFGAAEAELQAPALGYAAAVGALGGVVGLGVIALLDGVLADVAGLLPGIEGTHVLGVGTIVVALVAGPVVALGAAWVALRGRSGAA